MIAKSGTSFTRILKMKNYLDKFGTFGTLLTAVIKGVKIFV